MATATGSALPVNRATCYSDPKGVASDKLERQQSKLLASAEKTLRPVLEPGEEIWYAAEATAPFSLLEFLTTGWIITFLKRCLLVVTDRRVLHLPATPSLQPKGSVAEARYADLSALTLSGGLGRSLALRYKNGKQEKFALRPAGFKKLRAVLERLPERADSTPAGGRCFLCPRCARRLVEGRYVCSNCNQHFKSRSRATKLSILLPGGGYFYTGHPILGIFDALAEGMLLLFLVVGLALLFEGDPEAPAIVGVFAVLLAMEKLVTIYHASHYVREYLPA